MLISMVTVSPLIGGLCVVSFIDEGNRDHLDDMKKIEACVRPYKT